ncbi:MAG TPA: NAD(P)H-dependent oxidoreductase [Rhizomicrobium sp.]|jgi:FMN-dependent NADH-azoreductase
MKSILLINCSPRGEAAESHWLSRQIVEHLLRLEPTAIVTERRLGDGTIPHIDAQYATALGQTQKAEVEFAPQGSMAYSEELVQELERADFVVIGTPMHNFTVPSVLKAWIDHIARVRRTFDMAPDGKIALLADRPVFVAVSSGARYSGDRARQPDFLTPYLTFVLGMIGLRRVTFFSVEGTSSSSERLSKVREEAVFAIKDHFFACALFERPLELEL